MSSEIIDLVDDEMPPSTGEQAGMKTLTARSRGNSTLSADAKRLLLATVATQKPETVFDGEENIQKGKDVFEGLLAYSASEKKKWTLPFVAAMMIQIHKIIRASEALRRQNRQGPKRQNTSIVQLMEVVDTAIAKDKADAIAATATAKKRAKKLVRNAGPKNAPQYDLQMLDAIKAGTKEPFAFTCPLCNHPNCFPVQTAEDIDALNAQIEIDNKANEALAKAGGQKKRAQKSVSQEVACMCAGSSCFLLYQTSTCLACKKMVEDGEDLPFVSDPNDPQQQICTCTVRSIIPFENL
jgi:hypothetical protein